MGLVQFWCCQTRIEKYIELFWQETERERENGGCRDSHGDGAEWTAAKVSVSMLGFGPFQNFDDFNDQNTLVGFS